MPFTYNPPTRTQCNICDELPGEIKPAINTYDGKASSANSFPFHRWYNFVLGYSPKFPCYMLEREKITSADIVVDPFMGSGTTLVSCKALGIPSKGIDANDFMIAAARTKLQWDIDIQKLRKTSVEVLSKVEQEYERHESQQSYLTYAAAQRPDMLLQKYISDKPFAKVSILNDVLKQAMGNDPIRDFFDLALASLIVPVSNVRYGPGFGIIKPKTDSDVLGLFSNKLNTMIADLENVDSNKKGVKSEVALGDARCLSKYVEPNSTSLIITSPPYPGDHEYTKHTRLELIFSGYAQSTEEFRTIKKRMLRASTTNIYYGDNDKEQIQDLQSIKDVTSLIDERLEHDGATSGFERLYTKLVWEYFGGMYKTLEQCLQVLRPGGKIALLVSDSHAFKMVHIQTAQILKEIGERVGFGNAEIVLWQLKPSTSHKYSLRENILILRKP